MDDMEIGGFKPKAKPGQIAYQWDWLLVKLTKAGKKIMLPKGFKVKFKKRDKKRDYFILDDDILGAFDRSIKGEEASVKQKSENESYLVNQDIDNFPEPAEIKFAYNRKTRYRYHDPPVYLVRGKVSVLIKQKQKADIEFVLNAVLEDPKESPSPLPTGKKLNVKVWYRAHLGADYVKYYRHAATWFKIQKQGLVEPMEGHAFHVGRLSLGCISVPPPEKPEDPQEPWEDMYKKLMRCRRKPESDLVGKIELIDVTPT